tara:strand:+ start:2102 stop:2383 length:282 start_codon:yes stop_codon:yes gene_type:complete
MLGTDRSIYEKFVGLTAIVKIPALKFTISSGMISFEWKSGKVLDMEMSIFNELEPLEIVQRLEFEIERKYQVPAKHYRSDLSGYTKNPFSSQN